MATFKRPKKVVGELSTASLPDIVFMLLFFFMVSTTFREVELKVTVVTPAATAVKKVEKKSLVSFIYIGEPRPAFHKIYGTAPRMQLNDAFATVEDIRDFISSERDALNESDQGFMTVSLKVDEDCKMGSVTDVKQSLRKANALKIMYSTRKVSDLFKVQQ